MTVGSLTEYTPIGDYMGNYWRAKKTRAWSGADSAKPPKRVKTYEDVFIPPRQLLDGTWLQNWSYRRRVFKHDEPPPVRILRENAYSASGRDVREAWLSYNVGYSGVGVVLGDFGISLSQVNSPWSSNDDLALADKLRQTIQGSDWHAGISAGEASRSLRLVADSVARIAKCIKSLKRGNFQAAAKHLTGAYSKSNPKRLKSKNASDAFLELEYGWLPLISDADAALQYIAERTNTTNRQTFVATRFAAGFSGFAPIGTRVLSNTPGMLVNTEYSLQHSKRIRYIADLVDVPMLSGILDYRGVAYELTPWSFVADWALPTNAYISALNTQRSLVGTFVTTERKVLLERVVGSTLFYPSQTTIWNPDWLSWNTRSFSFERTIGSSLYVPKPSLKPMAKVSTVKHALDALALLVSVGTR